MLKVFYDGLADRLKSLLITVYRICRNKHPGRLIFRSNKTNPKTHQNPSVLCTPPFEKSPIKAHWFCVLPPLKSHPSKPIGFVYSPLWKVTHQSPLVLCTPPFEKSPIQTHRFCVLPPLKSHPPKPIGFVYSPLWTITVFGGRLFRVGVYCGKYGICKHTSFTLHFCRKPTNERRRVFSTLGLRYEKYCGIPDLPTPNQRK